MLGLKDNFIDNNYESYNIYALFASSQIKELKCPQNGKTGLIADNKT